MSEQKPLVYIEYARTMPQSYLKQSITFPWLGSILDLLAKRYLGAAELVLDVGCGLGTSSFYLASRGYRVIGIDIDCRTIETAAKFGQNTRVDRVILMVGDAKRIPFSDEKFEAILCFEVLEHIKNFGVAIRELKRVLKRDGICVISIPISRLMPFSIDWVQRKLTGRITIDEYAKHAHRLDPVDFLKLLEQNGFRVMRTIYYAQYLQPLLNFTIAMRRKSGARFHLRSENKVISKLFYGLRLTCMLVTKLEINLLGWTKYGSNIVTICERRL